MELIFLLCKRKCGDSLMVNIIKQEIEMEAALKTRLNLYVVSVILPQ